MVKKDDGVITKSYLDKHVGFLKTELLEIKEEILKELRDMREEFDVHQFSHLRINDELIEHGKRIRKLETSKLN